MTESAVFSKEFVPGVERVERDAWTRILRESGNTNRSTQALSRFFVGRCSFDRERCVLRGCLFED